MSYQLSYAPHKLGIYNDKCSATLFKFPKATTVGLVTTAVMPVGVDRIFHTSLINGLEHRIYRLELTDIEKTAATVGGIVMTGLLIKDPYLAILPSICTTMALAKITLFRYYGRKEP